MDYISTWSEKNCNEAKTEFKDKIEYLSSFITPDAVVLDAGAGVGFFTEIMSRKAKKVYSLDFSPKMLQKVRDRVKRKRLTNVTVVEGDITHMPFDSAFFDLVVSTSTLYYVFETEEAIAEIYRVLKKEARQF